MKRALILLLLAGCRPEPRALVVGSKKFTESVILGELAAQLATTAGARVTHRAQLGGTQLLWKALLDGAVDVYPEYTGTLRSDVLPDAAHATDQELRDRLAAKGVTMGAPLGFDDIYALGMREEVAARMNIRSISDLRAHPELRLGLSEEFRNRADGWPGVQRAYALPHKEVRTLDHDVGYRALASGAIDVVDLYSTDAEIREYRLRVLTDDQRFFPEYHAVLLWRSELAQRAPAVVAAFERLARRVDAESMRRMNARAKLEHISEAAVAENFLDRLLDVRANRTEEASRARRIWQRTGEHLELVLVSLIAAILCALPLGILAARRPRLGQLVVSAAGILQTIPSLALLVFMIPLVGIGAPPALLALFLYGLLPIVRNTCVGLRDIPKPLIESATALGLPPAARLRLVELPLASRAILAGIKTAAVIAVGTATLGALVGAGGYGQPILTGIRLDDVGLILEGAIPAALLALAVQGGFDLLERRWDGPPKLSFRSLSS
jgi:osmoprotectant transport system permease protein